MANIDIAGKLNAATAEGIVAEASQVNYAGGNTTVEAALKTAASDASAAKSDAAEAKTTATTAKTTADTAKSTATAAQSAAQSASDTANAAKTTAEKAASDASAAKSDASAAKSTADTAKQAADTAATDAAAAKSTAGTAKSTADTAKQAADTAATDAAAAKSTAGTAKSTADTAKQTAETASSRAQTATENAAAAKELAELARLNGVIQFTGLTEADATVNEAVSQTPTGYVYYDEKKDTFVMQDEDGNYYTQWSGEDVPAYGDYKTEGGLISGRLYYAVDEEKMYYVGDGVLWELDANLGTRLSEVEEAVWPTQASLTAGKTLLEYTGAAQAVKLSWSVKRKGAAMDVTSLVVTKSTGSGESEQVYSGTDNPGTQEAMVNFYGLTSFALKTEVSGKSYTASTRVQMVLPVYAGFAEAASDVGITSLVKQSLRTSAAGTYTLTNAATGNYLWLCVPSTMTVNRVTLNGFDVPMEAAEDGETTLGGYKCYRSCNQLTAQDFTFVVS